MKTHFTTSEALAASQVPRRTFFRWRKEGYFPVSKEGRGRGQSSEVSREAVLWIRILDEIFSLNPKASVEVYFPHSKKYDPPPARHLTDGKFIVDFITQAPRILFDDREEYNLVVALLSWLSRQTGSRNVEIHFATIDQAKANLETLWRGKGYYSRTGEFVTGVSLISLRQMDLNLSLRCRELEIC